MSKPSAAAAPVGIYRGLSEPATLAFKFLSPDPTPSAAWKLDVATEQLESWVRAEVVNLISVTETLVSGRALVRLDIANAPVKEFRLKIPVTVTNVDISGANIRRRDQTGDLARTQWLLQQDESKGRRNDECELGDGRDDARVTSKLILCARPVFFGQSRREFFREFSRF